MINIIRNPVGTYSFVGKVPVTMAHRIIGGTAADRNTIRNAVCHCGPGVARKIAERNGIKFETRTFDTANEARDFAEEYCRVNGLNCEING
jgi:hypothetical protein